jgi:osmotically inducible protein OsmC
MLRQATAVWNGGLKDGRGTLSTPTKVLTNVPYTFVTRFENTSGTSPEELVAAAHAGCFAMALSADLGRAGLTPQRIETTAEVTLDTVDGKPTVTKSHLKARATVPGADRATFEKIANETKAGCPISRLLKAQITLEATLEG